MSAFLASLLFVALAEMGDKTQLLAMAFATRFPARTVLVAVFCATLLNHALAMAAGRLLTTVIPVEGISLVAALSFILFGLWTVRGDTLQGEDERRSAFGPFLTVAVAFFLAELGDKTQLATISLAVKYSTPLAVLLGTTAGMVTADGSAILVGIVLGTRLPEGVIRAASAGIFIAFGLAGIAAVLVRWLPLAGTALVVFGLGVLTLAAVHAFVLRRRRVEGGARRASYDMADRLPQSLFSLLLLVAWVASLGLAKPLAVVDHWVAFGVLGGLGWKLIHGAVRPGGLMPRVNGRLLSLILLLAAVTSAQAYVAAFPLALAIGPVTVLLGAVAVLIGAPFLPRGHAGERLQRIRQHRLAISSSLILIGIALQVVLEHLA